MSEETTNPEGTGIADLRKQYDAIKKERDAQATELAAFRAGKRQGDVADALKDQIADPKAREAAAKLYSGEDTSADAVKKWAEEFAVLFGTAGNSAPPADDANAQAAQRVSQQAHGQPDEAALTPDGTVVGDPAQMEHLLRTLPYEELERRGWMPKRGTLFNQR